MLFKLLGFGVVVWLVGSIITYIMNCYSCGKEICCCCTKVCSCSEKQATEV